MRIRLVLRGLLLIAVLAAIGYALRGWDHLTAGWIDAEVRGHGLRGELLFVCLAALAAATGVPRQVVAFLAGYAFGFLAGTALALIAVILGCAMTFGFARVIGRGFVQARFSGRIRRVDRFLADNPFLMAVTIRLMPAGNNMITSLVAGVSRAPFVPFLAGSAIGYIPQTAIFALIGSGIEVASPVRIAVGTVLFVVAALLGVRLLSRYRELGEDALDERQEGSRTPPPGTRHRPA